MSEITKKDSKAASKKKKFTKPKLTVFGSVKDFTQAVSKGGPGDGGSFPSDKHMCITPPPAIEEHRVLLTDVICQNSFHDIILKTVKKGDVVLDLGTGSGIHTLFALKAGASKVYAIESDAIIEIAKEVIEENGYTSQVEFLHGDSTNIELPEKVDVIITNIGFLYTVNCLPDARKRFLKPGGQMIPSSVELSFVPVMADEYYKKQIGFWDTEKFGFKFNAFKKLAANHPQYSLFTKDVFLAEPVAVPSVDFYKDLDSVLKWQADYTVNKDGSLGGFAGWYAFQVDGEAFISTKPPLNMAKELWHQFFIPLDTPLEVNAGDKIQFNIGMAREAAIGGPIWTWAVGLNGIPMSEQSSLDALILNRKSLSKLSNLN
jgi:precorrin-6B methylase 2